jgi:5-methylcytosine-specific restriction protein A
MILMPTRTKKFCTWQGCNKLCSGRYCPEHEKAYLEKRKLANREYGKYRPTVTEQGYGADWRKVRDAYIRLHPLCEICEAEGRVVPAWGVDHKIEIKNGGERLDFNNLQSICFDCHEKKHPDRWKNKERYKKG